MQPFQRLDMRGLPNRRYYRARSTRRSEGIGLGLYITRLIVEAHGGRVWVDSEPGNGSTFGLSLPRSG